MSKKKKRIAERRPAFHDPQHTIDVFPFVCVQCTEIRDGRMHSMSAAFWVRFSIWLDLQQTREFAAAKRESCPSKVSIYIVLVPHIRRESQGQQEQPSPAVSQSFFLIKKFLFLRGCCCCSSQITGRYSLSCHYLSLNCLYAYALGCPFPRFGR